MIPLLYLCVTIGLFFCIPVVKHTAKEYLFFILPMDAISWTGPLHKGHKHLVYFLLVVAAFILIRNAWVGDDSYIGFRTSFNFAHGHGLTFNINERVQSFTNPIWTMLIGALSIFTGEVYLTSTFVSIVLTMMLLYYASLKIAKDVLSILLIFGFALSSKSFIDYSACGLENPLSHFLIVLFFSVYLKEDRLPRRWFLLSIIAAIAGVHRLDNLILYLVPLLVELSRHFSFRTIKIMSAGFIPLVVWELFSLFYFGFLLPNTYYMKMNTGIQTNEYVLQGIRYLINSIDLDPLTMITICFSIVAVSVYSFKTKKFLLFPFAVSIALYILYTLSVGGDFMSGRFLSAPFILAVVLLARMEFEPLIKFNMLGLIGILCLINPYAPVKSDSNYRRQDWNNNDEIMRNEGVSDERVWYFPNTGLIKLSRGLYIWQMERDQRKFINRGDSIVAFRECPVTLGFETYLAGPHVYAFHHMGLSDALIARLPMDRSKEPFWHVGHYHRKIPEGYPETLSSGRNEIKDKNLALYYDKLKLIIRGDLFSWERLLAIYEMNTGKFDHLIDKHYYSGAMDYLQ